MLPGFLKIFLKNKKEKLKVAKKEAKVEEIQEKDKAEDKVNDDEEGDEEIRKRRNEAKAKGWDSFAKLRAKGGFDSQIKFLQENVITPILNRGIYEKCGKLEEKVPRGVVLYGDSKEGISSLARALAMELYIEEGKIWSGFERHTGPGNPKLYLKDLFEKTAYGVKLEHVSVFLNDFINPSCDENECSAGSKRAAISIAAAMAKSTPGDILVIVGVDKLSRIESVGELRSVFSKSVHVPELMTTEMMKNLLTSYTFKKWEKKIVKQANVCSEKRN